MPALYRKYRSGSFKEVLGQSQVTDILEASLARQRTAQGYLFVGPHGVGKTSVARILAFAINGLAYEIEKKHLDIIEIDAASNTGVDNIRDLIERAQIAPSLAKKKIYIIDEVHMLSKSAFNALLKLLEEPPAHVVFILATTEEHKIPATIASRMQKFVFRKISKDVIVQHLTEIATKEKIRIETAALEAIAELGGGSMRDSIGLFDQISNLTNAKVELDRNTVRRVLGLIDDTLLQEILDSYIQKSFPKCLDLVKQIKTDNISASEIAKQLAEQAESQISQKPVLVKLITDLLEVSRSSLPDLSLSLALYQKSEQPTLIESEHSKALKSATNSEIKDKNNPEPVSQTPEKTSVNSGIANQGAISNKNHNRSDDQIVISHKIYQLDWKKFTGLVAESAKPIASYIKNASYSLEGPNLKIKLRSSFEKKTIDAPNRISKLYDALTKLELGDLNIETIVNEEIEQANKKMADVIQFMGGGEEIKIDEQI